LDYIEKLGIETWEIRNKKREESLESRNSPVVLGFDWLLHFPWAYTPPPLWLSSPSYITWKRWGVSWCAASSYHLDPIKDKNNSINICLKSQLTNKTQLLETEGGKKKGLKLKSDCVCFIWKVQFTYFDYYLIVQSRNFWFHESRNWIWGLVNCWICSKKFNWIKKYILEQRSHCTI